MKLHRAHRLRSRCSAARRLAASGTALPAQGTPAQAVEGVLGLSAQASVEVTKDLLAITFSTSRQGVDANAVQAQLKQALDAALAEARKAARPGQVEVQTGNFSLYPRYASGSGRRHRRSPAGRARPRSIVEGRDMAAIGQLAGRITTMTVARVAHRLSRQASQRVEAEIAVEAIARYRAKAAEYAKQFGYGGYAIREVNVATSEPTRAGADDAHAGGGRGARRRPVGRARQGGGDGDRQRHGADEVKDGAMTEPRLRHVQCLDARGLHRMAYWDWGDPGAERVLVCAHGLTRQGRDFDTLARAMRATTASSARTSSAAASRTGWSTRSATRSLPTWPTW